MLKNKLIEGLALVLEKRIKNLERILKADSGSELLNTVDEARTLGQIFAYQDVLRLITGPNGKEKKREEI